MGHLSSGMSGLQLLLLLLLLLQLLLLLLWLELRLLLPEKLESLLLPEKLEGELEELEAIVEEELEATAQRGKARLESLLLLPEKREEELEEVVVVVVVVATFEAKRLSTKAWMVHLLSQQNRSIKKKVPKRKQIVF